MQIYLPLKTKRVGSFETSETVYSVTQYHIPEEQKLRFWEELKTRKYKEGITEVENEELRRLRRYLPTG